MPAEEIRPSALAYTALFAAALRANGFTPVRTNGTPWTDEELDAYIATEHGGAMYRSVLADDAAARVIGIVQKEMP